MNIEGRNAVTEAIKADTTFESLLVEKGLNHQIIALARQKGIKIQFVDKQVLDKIDIDGVIDSEYLVNFLSKRPYSIVKQVGKTEKPDIAVAKMLEGRVVIIVDGSPIALSVPFLFLCCHNFYIYASDN